MLRYIDKIFRQALAKRILLYGYYLFLIWVIHLFLVSGVAFFHFLLDHRLGVVEDWIFDRGWELLIITKLGALYVFSRYINVGMNSRTPIRTTIKEGIVKPPLEIFSLMVVFIVIIFWVGQVQRMPYVWHGIGRILIAYIGVLVFYLCDILVLIMIAGNYSLNYLHRNIALFIFPVLFYGVNKLVFMYAANIEGLVFVTIFLSVYLSRWRRYNWSVPTVFVSLAIAPLSVLFGEDPMWADSYSPWGFRVSPSWQIYYILSFLGLVYLFLRKHTIEEIKRYTKLKLKRLFRSNL